MKELLFALSIFGSWVFGVSALVKLIRNQKITGFHMVSLGCFVTALITKLLGMW